jgi:hypothetical protein
MKIILYMLTCSSLLLGLFTSLIYLMTVVDPDLKELHKKASLLLNGDTLPTNFEDDESTTLVGYAVFILHTYIPSSAHYRPLLDIGHLARSSATRTQVLPAVLRKSSLHLA